MSTYLSANILLELNFEIFLNDLNHFFKLYNFRDNVFLVLTYSRPYSCKVIYSARLVQCVASLTKFCACKNMVLVLWHLWASD